MKKKIMVNKQNKFDLIRLLNSFSLDAPIIKIKKFTITPTIIILFFILLFAAYLRLYALGVPPFWVDEAISAIVGKNLINTGVLGFGSGMFYTNAPLFHFFEAISFAILGINDFAARFPSVIFGLMTILLCYLIGREYSKPTGLVAALICAVFFVEVFYSRQARFYQLFQLLFFATLYSLYKSKNNPKYLITTTGLFFLTATTQPSGIILAPFIILHILLFNRKKWFFTLLPIGWLVYSIGFIEYVLSITKIKSILKSIQTTKSTISPTKNILYFQTHIKFILSCSYFIILAIPGLIIGLKNNWRLSSLILFPALGIFVGVAFIDLISFRYVYVFFIPVFIFLSVFVGWIWKKFTPLVGIILIIILLMLSNAVNPSNYLTMIYPPTTGFSDNTAPELNLKDVPPNILEKMRQPDSIIITHFSPITEWYIKKPTYVLPFTLTGKGSDQVSMKKDNNTLVDKYSGAEIMTSLSQRPSGEYFVVKTYFAISKLKLDQIKLFNDLTSVCKMVSKNTTTVIYQCQEN